MHHLIWSVLVFFNYLKYKSIILFKKYKSHNQGMQVFSNISKKFYFP